MPIYYYNPYEEQYAMYRNTMQMLMTGAMNFANQKYREKELKMTLEAEKAMAEVKEKQAMAREKRQFEGQMFAAGYEALPEPTIEERGGPYEISPDYVQTRYPEGRQGPYGGYWRRRAAEEVTTPGGKPLGYEYGGKFMPTKEVEGEKEAFFVPGDKQGFFLEGVKGQYEIQYFSPGSQPVGAIPYSPSLVKKDQGFSEVLIATKGDASGLPPGSTYQKTSEGKIVPINKEAIKMEMRLAAHGAGIDVRKLDYPVGHPKGLNPAEAKKLLEEMAKQQPHWMNQLLNPGLPGQGY